MDEVDAIAAEKRRLHVDLRCVPSIRLEDGRRETAVDVQPRHRSKGGCYLSSEIGWREAAPEVVVAFPTQPFPSIVVSVTLTIFPAADIV